MAPSFSNCKIISAFVVDSVSAAIHRRGYAAASGGSAVRSNVMMKKGAEESNKTTSWVPDPVTGYYRPDTHVKDIDAAELRNMLLKNKSRQH